MGYVSFVCSNCWTDVSLVGMTGSLHPGEGLHFHALRVPDQVFLCQDTINAFVYRWPSQLRLKIEVLSDVSKKKKICKLLVVPPFVSYFFVFCNYARTRFIVKGFFSQRLGTTYNSAEFFSIFSRMWLPLANRTQWLVSSSLPVHHYQSVICNSDQWNVDMLVVWESRSMLASS